ncbi:MAG: hypothetical protein ABJM83_02325, partial [Paracoccaceae bacterium]
AFRVSGGLGGEAGLILGDMPQGFGRRRKDVGRGGGVNPALRLVGVVGVKIDGALPFELLKFESRF